MKCILSMKVYYIVVTAVSPCRNTTTPVICSTSSPRESIGRIVPPFRQLYQETVSELQTEMKATLVDLGHKSAFDLLDDVFFYKLSFTLRDLEFVILPITVLTNL